MHLFTSKFVKKPDHVTELPGSVSTPMGFSASGIAAGLKKSGKPDLGLLVAINPAPRRHYIHQMPPPPLP